MSARLFVLVHLSLFLAIVVAACDFGELCPTSPTGPSAGNDASPHLSSGNPYVPGGFAVKSIDLDRCEEGAPLKLRVVAPEAAGTYSVVVLQHAFQVTNHSYDQIASHIASHGFVVILPRMYDPGLGPIIGMPTAVIETQRAAVVIDWIPSSLDKLPGVQLNTASIGLAGHSRGGKVAFGVVKSGSSRVKALAGIDPVDGTGGPGGNQPRVTNESLAIDIPTLIVGAGLGGPCAPTGDNYRQFFDASPTPSTLIIADEFGHGDMLDDETAALAASVCPSNENREPMRRLTAGLLVAFFRAHLQGDPTALDWINANDAPATVSIEQK